MNHSPRCVSLGALVALFALLVLLANGCKPTQPLSPATPVSTTSSSTLPGAAAPARTGAATLRARLTYLLTEHVYLTGAATASVVSGATADAALAALDANSHGLADLYGEVYGPGAGGQLYGVWTRRVSLMVAYAQAKAAGDTSAHSSAKAGLAAARDDLALLISSANVYLLKQTLATELDAVVAAQLDTIDAQAAKNPAAGDKLAAAASLVPHTADLVAAAIVKAFPARYPGTATGTAANLLAAVTSTLVGHVYATAAATASATGTDAAATASTLDSNSRALANLITGIYGDAAGRPFYALWSGHVGLILGYAKAALSGDASRQAAARSALAGFGSRLAAVLARLGPKFPAALAADVDLGVTRLLSAVDAQVAGAADRYTVLRGAAEGMVATAQVVAEAIAEQFPDRYLP